MNELIGALQDFTDSAARLVDVITDQQAGGIVSSGYPFDRSFDEVFYQIIDWKNAIEKEIKEDK